MMVIYHDVGGAHSTAVAANIHINKLSMNKVPTKEELFNLPTFDKIEKEQIGRLIYIGEDEFHVKIYTLARKYSPDVVLPAIKDMYVLLHGNDSDLFIIDTKPTVNLLMNIGGYTSRKLHLVSFGRPIVTKGTQQAYMNIVNVVKDAKNAIKKFSVKPK